MNNTKKKLSLTQETVRIMTQNQDQPLITTMPWCPTGLNAPVGDNDVH